MAKVRNLSDIQQEIAFTEFDYYQRYEESFKTSEFGRIKSLLPLRDMAISFGLVEEKPKSLRTKRGRKSFFTPEGNVVLAFLKMYTGLSAPKLRDALNGNIHYQIFCGIRISLGTGLIWPPKPSQYTRMYDYLNTRRTISQWFDLERILAEYVNPNSGVTSKRYAANDAPFFQILSHSLGRYLAGEQEKPIREGSVAGRLRLKVLNDYPYIKNLMEAMNLLCFLLLLTIHIFSGQQ